MTNFDVVLILGLTIIQPAKRRGLVFLMLMLMQGGLWLTRETLGNFAIIGYLTVVALAWAVWKRLDKGKTVIGRDANDQPDTV